MADSMVASKITGSVADLNVSSSTRMIAQMAMRFVVWLSTVTTARMSERLVAYPADMLSSP